MTLITHIWNGNQTILAGDGRVMENGRIWRDDMQKVLINKKEKFGIAIGGNLPTIGTWSPYDQLHNLVRDKDSSSSLNKFSKKFQKSFASLIPRRAKPYSQYFKIVPLWDNLIYLNNVIFWKSKYKIKVNKNTPSSCLPNHSNINAIIKNIFSDKNIFISYAFADGLSKGNKTWQRELRLCETAVKFCLKNNTIGDSQSLQTFQRKLKEKNQNIIITSKNDSLLKYFYPRQEQKKDNLIYYGYECRKS